MNRFAPNMNIERNSSTQRNWHQEDSVQYSAAQEAPGDFLRQLSWIFVLAVLLMSGSFSTSVFADPSRKGCLKRLNNSQAKLLRCITQDGLQIHAEELQQIADDNDGYRASGSPGYDASVQYVAHVMEDAGYDVLIQEVIYEVPNTDNVLVGHNVIAELPKGNPHNVIILGAHLDSVPAGPGLNDNGSGSVALLELALMTKKLNSINRVRYAWWAFEEVGLVGSAAYLNGLTDEELGKLVLHIGPDMMGSPNAIRWIETFDSEAPGTEDQQLIEHRNELSQLFRSKFEEILGFEASTAVEQPFLPDFVGCGFTDYCNFLNLGIPAMDAIFTGTRFEAPSESEAARFGVVAGAPSDPCYHRACDTVENIDFLVLEENTDVTAAVLFQLMFDENIRDFDFASH
jgi:aminopeptidase S